jgi:hypothetical protein
MENAQELTSGFRYDFTESQLASCPVGYFSVKIVTLGSLKQVTVPEEFSKLARQ